MPRDAAEIGKVGTNPVLPAEFESAPALSCEVRPQLPLLRGLAQHEDAGLDRAQFRLQNSSSEMTFILNSARLLPRTREIARLRRHADKGPSLGAQKKGAVLPLSGEENYGRNCRNSSPSPTFSCGRGRGEGSGTLQASYPDIDCLAFRSHLNRENMLSARSLAPLAGRVTVAILLASS